MKIGNFYSPKFNRKKRSKNLIKIIIIHYTGMQSERESIIRLCNPKFKVSSHFLINQNGKVYRLVQDNRIAWHAGKSCWGKYKNLNKNSIGIELVNKGHRFGYTNFRKKQLLSLTKICKNLIKKYKIKKKNKKRIQEELGDMLFASLDVARKLQLNPEISLAKSNKKFSKRWRRLEQFIINDKKEFNDLNLKDFNFYWNKAKIN